jgi:leucyl-tRNA synthetase
VVSPDDFVSTHGSDVFRLYLLFMGPFQDGADWSDSGINGTVRFVKRAYAVFSRPSDTDSEPEDRLEILVHETIQSVTKGIMRFHFNTAVSSLMKLLNALEESSCLTRDFASIFIRLMAPLAPHLSEELWRESLGEAQSVFDSPWPVADKAVLSRASTEVPIMVGKKIVCKINVPNAISDSEQESMALENGLLVSYLKEHGLQIKRVISRARQIVTVIPA